MLGPVTCAACGAKVREDRVRCLRCGATLAANPVSDAPDPGLPRTAGIWLAGLLLVGGLGIVMMNRREPVTTKPRTSARTSGATSARSTSPAISGPATGASLAVGRSREGVMAYGRGDMDGAIDRFQAAVDADPHNAMALNDLGQALVRANRVQEALPHFDQAVALSPVTWAYRFNRARAYGLLERWSEAVDEYREAATLFPEDYVTRFNLARALQANGDLSGAIDSYRQAVALAPGQPDFLLSLANALETAGQGTQAAEAYRRYLELEPAGPHAEKIKQRISQLTPATS